MEVHWAPSKMLCNEVTKANRWQPETTIVCFDRLLVAHSANFIMPVLTSVFASYKISLFRPFCPPPSPASPRGKHINTHNGFLKISKRYRAAVCVLVGPCCPALLNCIDVDVHTVVLSGK